MVDWLLLLSKLFGAVASSWLVQLPESVFLQVFFWVLLCWHLLYSC